MQSKGHNVGYVRVSTADQNTGRQLEGVVLDKTFIEKASGKDTKRPILAECLAYVREGDTLHVHSMDRLARNLDDLRQVVRDLNGHGVAVQFHKENMTFTGDDSPMSTLLLSMLGAFAEFERSLILERQREGIAIAKAKGLYTGRKPSLGAKERIALLAKASTPAGQNKAALAREYGISRETLYRYLRVAPKL